MVPIYFELPGQFASNHFPPHTEQRFTWRLEGIFCNLWSQPASSQPVGLLLEASPVLHQALALHPDRAALSNRLHGNYSVPLKSHLALLPNDPLFKPCNRGSITRHPSLGNRWRLKPFFWHRLLVDLESAAWSHQVSALPFVKEEQWYLPPFTRHSAS